MFLIMSYKRIQRECLKRINLTPSKTFSNYSEISRKENNYHIQSGIEIVYILRISGVTRSHNQLSKIGI